MWISNTATTLMLLPVALAVLDQDEKSGGGDTLKIPLLLGIAYVRARGVGRTLARTVRTLHPPLRGSLRSI